MAVNKNAMLRYLALDRCFRDKWKKYDIDALVEACNESLFEFYGSDVTVQKRQVYEDIKFMKSDSGWSIPLERRKEGRRTFFRYDGDFSIEKIPLKDSEIDVLRQAVISLRRFTDSEQFSWLGSLLATLEDKLQLRKNEEQVLSLDSSENYNTSKYMHILFNAIINRKVLAVDYNSFKGRRYAWNIHPYHLKQYNNRWFLLGRNDESLEQIVTIPLDRINDVQGTEIKYIENTEIDFNGYFDDVVGVTVQKNKPIEEVWLQFSPELYPYVVSKPPHHSMIRRDKEYTIILKVVPNYELKALIYSYVPEVEVLEPLWLRDEIKEGLEKMIQQYK